MAEPHGSLAPARLGAVAGTGHAADVTLVASLSRTTA